MKKIPFEIVLELFREANKELLKAKQKYWEGDMVAAHHAYGFGLGIAHALIKLGEKINLIDGLIYFDVKETEK